MKFTLPRAISGNHLYAISTRGGRVRRFRTAKGNAWFDEAGYAIMSQRKGRKPIQEAIVYVTLYYCRPIDIDNAMKATLDLLQHQHVIENDKDVMELHIYKEKVKTVKEEKMEVRIEKWEQ